MNVFENIDEKTESFIRDLESVRGLMNILDLKTHEMKMKIQ